jgi:hypothetical protein
MVIDMNETKLTTLEQVRMFLAGTAEIGFCVTGEGEDGRYRHIAGVLKRFGCKRLKKPDKGLILRYLERTTGAETIEATAWALHNIQAANEEPCADRSANGFRRIVLI